MIFNVLGFVCNDQRVAKQLAAQIGPFLLRRKKSDPSIAPELPEKTETEQLVQMTAEQVSNDLNGFAESHVVGEAPTYSSIAECAEPSEPPFLIVAKSGLQNERTMS